MEPSPNVAGASEDQPQYFISRHGFSECTMGSGDFDLPSGSVSDKQQLQHPHFLRSKWHFCSGEPVASRDEFSGPVT